MERIAGMIKRTAKEENNLEEEATNCIFNTYYYMKSSLKKNEQIREIIIEPFGKLTYIKSSKQHKNKSEAMTVDDFIVFINNKDKQNGFENSETRLRRMRQDIYKTGLYMHAACKDQKFSEIKFNNSCKLVFTEQCLGLDEAAKCIYTVALLMLLSLKENQRIREIIIAPFGLLTFTQPPKNREQKCKNESEAMILTEFIDSVKDKAKQEHIADDGSNILRDVEMTGFLMNACCRQNASEIDLLGLNVRCRQNASEIDLWGLGKLIFTRFPKKTNKRR